MKRLRKTSEITGLRIYMKKDIEPTQKNCKGIETEVKLVNVLVFPIVWSGDLDHKKSQEEKIDAFEIWYCRRVMRVSVMDGVNTIYMCARKPYNTVGNG